MTIILKRKREQHEEAQIPTYRIKQTFTERLAGVSASPGQREWWDAVLDDVLYSRWGSADGFSPSSYMSCRVAMCRLVLSELFLGTTDNCPATLQRVEFHVVGLSPHEREDICCALSELTARAARDAELVGIVQAMGSLFRSVTIPRTH